MTIRRFLLAAVSFSLFAPFAPAIVRADEAPASADIDMGKHNFIGEVNGNSVFVRSAPREDAYPTMKLDKGRQVTVVGIKFKWLKILPPDGSFAFVQKAYVNKRGAGNIGRASREMFAKAGSEMNQLKTATMGKVDDGQDVEILGEQDEWYKIKPPAGSFVYINQSFVTPVRVLPTAEEQKAQGIAGATNPPARPAADPRRAQPASAAVGPNLGDPLTTVTPGPGTGRAAPLPPVAVSTAAAVESFDKLEADFNAANERPIGDQPAEALLISYNDLLKQNGLSGHEREIAKVRVSTLTLRVKAKADFLALQQSDALAADQKKAQKAEREEIQARIDEKKVTFYAVVGTLRASSLQRGIGTLFRVTDPATGRTLAYARVTDGKYSAFLGQFIGVKGLVTNDTGLGIKIIEQPTDIEAVDPTRVNDSVAAQIVPPSLMPAVHTARSSAE
jgi:SH3-like domain-containing protein